MNVKKSKKTHTLFLISCLIFLWIMYIFRESSLIQLEIVILTITFYLISSFFYHHLDKSLTLEIMIEYILIGLLSLIILQGILI